MPKKSESSKAKLQREARQQTERRHRRERSERAKRGAETRRRRQQEGFYDALPVRGRDWWEHEAPLHEAIEEVGGVRKEYPIRRK